MRRLPQPEPRAASATASDRSRPTDPSTSTPTTPAGLRSSPQPKKCSKCLSVRSCVGKEQEAKSDFVASFGGVGKMCMAFSWWWRRIVLSKALLTATNRARPLRSGSTGVDARLRNGPDQLASRVDPACRTLESPSFPPCPAPSTIDPAPLPLRRCRSASGSGADDPRVSLTPACPAAVAPARRSARAQAQPPRIPDPDARG